VAESQNKPRRILGGRQLYTTAFGPTMQSHNKEVFRGSAERGVKI